LKQAEGLSTRAATDYEPNFGFVFSGMAFTLFKRMQTDDGMAWSVNDRANRGLTRTFPKSNIGDVGVAPGVLAGNDVRILEELTQSHDKRPVSPGCHVYRLFRVDVHLR
jgi:hypothetical protein